MAESNSTRHPLITTGSFASAGKNANAISIARWAPKAYAGHVYEQLAPSMAMLKIRDVTEFYSAYRGDILDKLNPLAVWDDLHHIAGPAPILLCWEHFNVCCHRRMVSEWLEEALSITIPEINHDRAESLPWREMPLKPPSTRWKNKSTGPHRGSLFGPKA